MPNDKILIEIMTMANTAGIKEAQSSMLGFNAVNMAATVGLGAFVVAAKSAVEITQEHTHAEANLASAIANRNAQVGKVPPPDPEAEKAVAAATKAHAEAVRALQYVEVGATADHKLSTLESMHLADAQAKVRETTDALTKAQARLKESTNATWISTQKAREQLKSFMQTNRDFISNQNEIVNGYASLIREGVPATEVQGLMATALNISAIEGISFTDAVDKLQSAEAGRNKGLSKLVGLTLEAIPATATLAEKHTIVAANMKIVDQAYRDGKDAIDPLTRATNDLKTDWELIAETYGPHLIDEMDRVAKDIDKNMPSWLTWLGKVGEVGDQLAGLLNLAAGNVDRSGTETHNDIFGKAAPGSPGSKQYVRTGSINAGRAGQVPVYSEVGSAAYPGQAQSIAPASQNYGFARATGGPVGGADYLVGERGPEIRHFGAGGSIIPNNAKGGGDIHIHINNPIGGDGPYWDKIANQIAQRLSYATGR